MKPNNLREYFVLNKIQDKYMLTRIGSFESPGEAITCAKLVYAEGLFTVLTAPTVGMLLGVVAVMQHALTVNPEAALVKFVTVYKYLSEDKLIGSVCYNNNYANGSWEYNTFLAPIPNQEFLDLTVTEAQELYKTIGLQQS